MQEADPQLPLKKRARRRLVGAIAFVTLLAVFLPMLMDHEPRQPSQDVEIRIPGQDEKPFAPKFAGPADKAAPPAAAPGPRPVEATVPRPVEAPKAVEVAKPVAVPPVEKPAPVAEKPAAKPADKPAEKAGEKPSGKPGAAEAQRAAAILDGKVATPAAAAGGEQVILIGAFANEGNVKQIKAKLGELGIRVYTEPLDSPQGKNTRVRAGPFPNREAAEKALEKMKRIGVSGVVAARP
jgi:DedD protein